MNTPSFKSPARREAGFLLLLIVVVLGTRIPFLMHGLDEWDTANFALSILHFSVMTDQPHAPGQYFYVLLLRGLNALIGNPLLTLSLASAVGSSLALVPYYYTLRQVFRPAVAMGAAVLTAFTFGYWITGLRMISDPVGTLFVYGTVGALLAGLRDRRWFVFGMVLCGVTLGVKQTAVYFLAPFAVAVNLLVLFRHGWRRPLLGSAGFGLAVAAWLIPTVLNCGSWANYAARCREKQQENYAIESIIFHFSKEAGRVQWEHNGFQPWGSDALAVVMLILAAAGLLLCLRRGVRGGLFALFSLTVAFYAFFFLYRFNKYFVYYVPIYCAFAAAALFALGDFLARQTGAAFWRNWLPGAAIAVLTAVNVSLTAPLLPKINHFRAPPQAALNALHKLPGVGPDPLLLTDDVAAERELTYFALQKQVDLLNTHPDLQDAVAALNAGRKVYFLSATTFADAGDASPATRLLGRYEFRPELFVPLQGRGDLRQLSLYEVSAPLPLRYEFDHAAAHPPLLLEGMSQDGWCGASVRVLLPGEEAGPDLVHLGLTVPEDFAYRYPYRMLCQFADGTRQELTVEHAGRSDFVVPLPVGPGLRALSLQLLSPQTFHLSPGDPRLTDNWNLAVHLDELTCVTGSRPFLSELGQGWYGQETDGQRQWRWINSDATLSVLSARPGTLNIAGSMLSFTPANTVDVLVDGQPAATSALPGEGWSSLAFHLPIAAGFHVVTLHSRNPAAHPPGDNRMLALRVRDLQVRLAP